MARICQICGRGPRFAQRRSYSNIATKRKQQLNLQIATIKGKRMRVCTRCLKNLAKKAK